MQELTRHVSDIDATDRSALEHLLGRPLADDHLVVIRVEEGATVRRTPIDTTGPVPKLPDWCNVYEGLTDEEIEDLERSLVRHREPLRPLD